MSKPESVKDEGIKTQWEKLAEQIKSGDIPEFCYANKATFEGALKRKHFELLEGAGVKLRISPHVPDNTLYFLWPFGTAHAQEPVKVSV